MDRLTLKIGGVDFTEYVKRNGGFTYSYDRREGSNGGLMLDGSKTVDLIASKLVVSVAFNPMPQSIHMQLLSLL